MTSRRLDSNVKRLMVILIFSFPLILGRANGATTPAMTYQRDYSYQASESDSKISCRTIALEQVKRLLLEELGSYLVSQTEVKNYQISRDQVIAITAGVVRTEVLNEKWDGKTYYIVAKITTDPGQVAKAIAEIRKDKQGLSDLEEVKKRTEELLLELQKLREELKSSKGGERKRENKDYTAAVKKLGAVDWFKEGSALMESRKFRDAISFFNKAIDADPAYAMAYTGRGWAYYQLRDYPSALKDTSRSLELQPNSPFALANRSNTLWAMRQYDKALADINRAVELKPDFSRAYEVRSLIHVYMKNNVNAVEDANKAIELNSNNPYAYLNRGNANRNAGRYEEALRDYQKSLDINPANPDVYHSRGFAYFSQKKYDDALRDYNKALELNQNPATALHSSATALMQRSYIRYHHLKDSAGAVQDLSKAIELERDNAAAYYHRSLIYKQIGRAEESASDMKKAAQLGDERAQRAIKK